MKPMKDNTQRRFNAFKADLVKKFGDNVEVSRKDIATFWNKYKEKRHYPVMNYLTLNKNFLTRRGHFLITSETEEKKILQAKKKFLADQKAKAKLLTNEEKNDVQALAKRLTKNNRKPAAKKTATNGRKKTAAKRKVVAKKTVAKKASSK